MGGEPRAGRLSCVVGVADPAAHILLFCKVMAEIGMKWSHLSRSPVDRQLVELSILRLW